MKHITAATASLLGVALLTGCYPDVPEYIDEYDLVLTDYSPDFDFAAHGTYSLPDSVVKITGALAEGQSPEMLNPVYGDQILGRIRSNMNAYGWTEVDNANDADVLVLPSITSTTYISYSYYYWGWYYPWYGGWYYPGYYPPTISSLSTGSVIIQMANQHDPSVTDNLPVVWLTVINGLAEGGTSNVTARVNKYVDQAFAQSKYLKQ